MPNVLPVPDVLRRCKRVIVLDFDGTLYRSPTMQRKLHEAFVAYAARALGTDRADIECRLKKFRANSDAPGELVFLDECGVSIEDWLDIAARNASDARAIRVDPAVMAALADARSLFFLALTSNSPWALIEATLKGRAHSVFDLIACPRVPDARVAFPRCGKPSASLYRSILDALSVAPADAVAIGDRHEIDIAPAEAIGMRGVLLTPGQDLDEVLLGEIDSARSSK